MKRFFKSKVDAVAEASHRTFSHDSSRSQRKPASSPRQSDTSHVSATSSRGSNSTTSTSGAGELRMEDSDRPAKRTDDFENRLAAKLSGGGGRTYQPRGPPPVAASGAVSGRSQEERDRLMKQQIKQQRSASDGKPSSAAGASSFAYSSAGNSSSFERLSGLTQEERDKQTKEIIKRQREAGNATRPGASSINSTESGGGGDSRKPPGGTRCSSKSADVEARKRRLEERRRQLEEEARQLEMEEYDEFKQEEKTPEGDDNDDDMGSLPQDLSRRPIGRTTMVHQNLLEMHMQQFSAINDQTATLGPNSLVSIDEDVVGEYENLDASDGALEAIKRTANQLNSHSSLAAFERVERKKNQGRRESKRQSITSVKIEAWHNKYNLRRALQLAERSPHMEWLSSFYRCDPRWQIGKFFDEVAREGGEAPMDEDLAASPLACLFNKASVFTVWRPTSGEAIKNMMLGIATGKGLDIKGKSAKKGHISSYVPFIQIFEEQHKERVRAMIKDGRTVRVFYQSEEARSEAYEMLSDIRGFMLFAAEDAMRVLSDEYADEAEQELAMKHLMYDDTNLSVVKVDTYLNAKPPSFGLCITERLFWESYVMMQDCSRDRGTEWDIGRKSEPAYMEMNFKAVRHAPEPGEPRAVVYQYSKTHPMEPRTLLMAYEEYGKVKPVVSDFDCFLLGSRGVRYKDPIPEEQVELLKWSLKNIGETLDERAKTQSKEGWMEGWFKVTRQAALKGYFPKTPKYGNGDPKSYEIFEVAASRLQDTGCVRHGAECFNWWFPQDIDDELLVVSDTLDLPGGVKWMYVNPTQLQEILLEKIDEGFSFPINPKWVLCDPGWRRVYDKLLASRKANVQDSLDCWFPPGTGIREEIDRIYKNHPYGLEGVCNYTVYASEKNKGTEYRDLAENELEIAATVGRCWMKVRQAVIWIGYLHTIRREIEAKKKKKSSTRGRCGDISEIDLGGLNMDILNTDMDIIDN